MYNFGARRLFIYNLLSPTSRSCNKVPFVSIWQLPVSSNLADCSHVDVCWSFQYSSCHHCWSTVLSSKPDCLWCSDYSLLWWCVPDIVSPALPSIVRDLAAYDANLTFFSKVLGYRDNETQQEVQNSLQFFSERFGLDFSLTEPNELGLHFFQNATLQPIGPVTQINATLNRWILSGNTRLKCFPATIGGFRVTFQDNRYWEECMVEQRGLTSLSTEVWGIYIRVFQSILLVNQCDSKTDSNSVACQLSASTSYRPGVYGQLSGIKTGVIRVALFFTLCKFCCVSCLLVYPV